jgi:DNA repair protein SbcD/Mre11
MAESDAAIHPAARKILAIGDVHLGTSPASVPSGLGPNEALLTPAQTLSDAVDFAIREGVKAVLFAGDVVESNNDRFEAFRPLQDCVARLVSAGIDVLGVAGNHDIEALPRLTQLIPEFTLLGAGGKWDSIQLTDDGAPYAQILGWSFGQRTVSQSPLPSLMSSDISVATDMPSIGLMHCDLGVVDSPYAPVRTEELNAVATSTWLLGHIHRPSLEVKDGEVVGRPKGYLGSLMGLHPLETGPHGPWLITLEGSQIAGMRQVPLAPLRWEHIKVDVDGLGDVEDIKDRIMAALAPLAGQCLSDHDSLKAIGVRVALVGTTHCVEELGHWIGTKDWDGLIRNHEGVAIFVNKVTDHTDLPLDVDEIAKGSSPPALLAQKIIMLRDNGVGANDLLAQARAKLSPVAEQYWWSPLKGHRNTVDPLADDQLRERLMLAARMALFQLIDQQDSEGVAQ